MKKIYKGEKRYEKQYVSQSGIKREELEKHFVFDFLYELPIDKLKHLINFNSEDVVERENDYSPSFIMPYIKLTAKIEL